MLTQSDRIMVVKQGDTSWWLPRTHFINCASLQAYRCTAALLAGRCACWCRHARTLQNNAVVAGGVTLGALFEFLARRDATFTQYGHRPLPLAAAMRGYTATLIALFSPSRLTLRRTPPSPHCCSMDTRSPSLLLAASGGRRRWALLSKERALLCATRLF